MESSTPAFDVNLNPSGFVVDLDSLYAHLARLRDRRHDILSRHSKISLAQLKNSPMNSGTRLIY